MRTELSSVFLISIFVFYLKAIAAGCNTNNFVTYNFQYVIVS